MKSTVSVHAGDCMKDLTINVTIKGVRGYRVRFWIGSQLIRLAARILRCKVAIEGADA